MYLVRTKIILHTKFLIQLKGLSSAVLRIENHGYEDGKCSMAGNLGQFLSDFILGPIHKNGYK